MGLFRNHLTAPMIGGEGFKVKQIVFCTDFSPTADEAFKTASEMAIRFSAYLTILHVLPPVVGGMMPEADRTDTMQPIGAIVLKLEERMQQAYGEKIDSTLNYEIKVLNGHISTVILEYLDSKDADLVVLGSYGLSGMGLVVFGSVAKRVAHKAPCSVMIVRTSASDTDLPETASE
jgi:universal stress protein A